MPADQAKPEMDPGIAGFNAILAFVLIRVLDLNLVEVRAIAGISHDAGLRSRDVRSHPARLAPAS